MTESFREQAKIPRPNNTDTYSVVLNYEDVDVFVSEEIQLTTLPDFISSVGGNLGLFIGFSCLPVLLKATDLIRPTKLHDIFSLGITYQ